MAGWKLRKDKTQAEPTGEENASPTPLAEASPEHDVPLMETHDDQVPLHTARWEMPAEDWTSPAAPITNESLTTVPLEDEPIAAEELHFAAAQLEEAQFHQTPLDLTAEAAPSAPRVDTAEEYMEDSEPAPHFDDDEVDFKDAGDTAETWPQTIELPAPMPAHEPVDIKAAKPIKNKVSKPKKFADSSPALEPETITPPEPELHIVAMPEPEPQVIVEPEPEALAAPVSPIFHIPAPAQTELSTGALHRDRSELTEAIPPPTGFSIPPVAPFLLDVPNAVIPETHHTLLVRIGRLSATFEMTKEVTVIGRPDSELHFYPDIEIEMDDAVSRRHAEILRHEDDFYLVDAGSTNGTLLNGEMLKPHEERRLAHGDRIRVGERTEIIFE